MALLNALANSMPVANQKLQNQRKAAADIQLQQAVAAAPASAPVQSTAAQLGAASAQVQGQQQVQAAQQNVQQQANLGAAAIADKVSQIQNNLTNVKQGMQGKQLSDEERFANLSSQAKQEMFDSRKQFATDEMGRKFLNERQLADYARVSGTKDEEFRNYGAKAQQAHQRSIQALQFAQQKIENALKQQAALGEQKQDHALMKELTQAKIDMTKRIAKAQADAANSAGMWTMGGTIAGAAAGALIAGPGGAAVGAQAGGALGAGVASQNQEEI
jgi:hypothetical protein